MRQGLLLLLLLVAVLPLAGSFFIEDMDFISTFSVSKADLIEAGGLIPGKEIEAEDLKVATMNIQNHLIRSGRQFVIVNNPQIIPLGENRIRLEYRIREALPSDNCSLEFAGLRYFSRAKLLDLLMIRENTALELRRLPQIMNRILEIYNSRAYLFASVKLDSLVLKPDSSLQAVVRIEEGKPFRPKSYIIEGNKHTRGGSLINTAGLNGIKQVGPDALESARQRILIKPYIKEAELIPLDEEKVLIRIEEGRMTYLEGVAGVSRSGNKTRLTGILALQFLNLWGSDRAIKLNWIQLAGSSSDLKLNYHDSGLEAYPFAADLSFARTQQDSLWIRSKMGLDLYYHRMAHQLGIELGTENVIPGYGRPPVIQKNGNRALGGFWAYDQSDHRSNPTRGLKLKARYRFFPEHKLKDMNTALELDAETFLPLNNRWVFAPGAHWRSLNYPDPEDHLLYSMGGYQSMRGYREDEFRAGDLGWANLELRYRLSRESRLFIFFDQGILSSVENEWKTGIFALGTGLKLGTKLGILSLEYALGYNGKSLNPIGLGMIHAGLDTSF